MDFCFVTLNQCLSSQIIFPMNKIDRSWSDLFKNVFTIFILLLWPSWISILQTTPFHYIFGIVWKTFFSINCIIFSWFLFIFLQQFTVLTIISQLGANISPLGIYFGVRVPYLVTRRLRRGTRRTRTPTRLTSRRGRNWTLYKTNH